MAEPPALVRHECVERINHWRQPECAEQAAHSPPSWQLGQQRHAPARIARNRRAVTQD